MDTATANARPYCYPVCFPCREAPCPKAVPPKQPQRWRPDPLSRTFLTCGCRCDIIPTVMGLINPSKVWCGRHGWVNYIKEKKGKKREDRKATPGHPDLFTADDTPPF